MLSIDKGLLSNTRVLMRGAIALDIAMIVLMTLLMAGLLLGDAGRALSNATPLSPESPLSGMSLENRLFVARVIVAGVLASCILILPLLRMMLHIVDTTRSGDPFLPENGTRLRRIGWLLLAINIIANITLSYALTKDVKFPPVDPTVVFTVLMLFVLARIFETGSRMRAELQETI